MASLGWDEPMWVSLVRERGPELAAAVMRQVDGISDLRLDTDPAAVWAAGTPTRPDRYTTAWLVTEALTELWSTVADDTVGLVVLVGSLRVDVPAVYFTDGVLTRRRWAALSTSQLVHTTVHETGSVGLFGDQPSTER